MLCHTPSVPFRVTNAQRLSRGSIESVSVVHTQVVDIAKPNLLKADSLVAGFPEGLDYRSHPVFQSDPGF